MSHSTTRPTLDDPAIRIPARAATRAGFRAWALSDEFPERGRFSFINGELFIDMSPEELETHNKQPRPEDVVLGGPPRGGHFRVVAPVGGVGVGKAPSGPFMVTRGPAPLDDSPTLPVRGCTAAPGPHPARRC